MRHQDTIVCIRDAFCSIDAETIPVFPPCCQTPDSNSCKSTNCTDSSQYDDSNAFKAEIFLIDSKREQTMDLGKGLVEDVLF